MKYHKNGPMFDKDEPNEGGEKQEDVYGQLPG